MATKIAEALMDAPVWAATSGVYQHAELVVRWVQWEEDQLDLRIELTLASSGRPNIYRTLNCKGKLTRFGKEANEWLEITDVTRTIQLCWRFNEAGIVNFNLSGLAVLLTFSPVRGTKEEQTQRQLLLHRADTKTCGTRGNDLPEWDEADDLLEGATATTDDFPDSDSDEELEPED